MNVLLHDVLVAQGIESLLSVREVMGSILVGDSFFVPQSCHVDQFTFHNVLFVFILETVVVGILYKDLHELFVANYSIRDGRDNSR